MIAVTGANGQLGRLVIDGVLRTTPADQVVAAFRSPEKAHDLAARGVRVREADYNRPETLGAAFSGAEKVLLISSNDPDRFPRHRAVADGAKATGVRLIAYTSGAKADVAPPALAADHLATKEYIRASGLRFILLCNNLYTENYVPAAQQGVAAGAILGAAGDRRIASAARADYASAAAAVLTGEGHEDTVYELAGDTAWSFPDLATTTSLRATLAAGLVR